MNPFPPVAGRQRGAFKHNADVGELFGFAIGARSEGITVIRLLLPVLALLVPVVPPSALWRLRDVERVALAVAEVVGDALAVAAVLADLLFKRLRLAPVLLQQLLLGDEQRTFARL